MTDGSDTAHPAIQTVQTQDEFNKPPYSDVFSTGGLTKRELFAAMAMQGRMSIAEANTESFELTALVAVEMADALIEALNKEPK